MVVVGSYILHYFTYCGLVVEIQIHLTANILEFLLPKPNVDQD